MRTREMACATCASACEKQMGSARFAAPSASAQRSSSNSKISSDRMEISSPARKQFVAERKSTSWMSHRRKRLGFPAKRARQSFMTVKVGVVEDNREVRETWQQMV